MSEGKGSLIARSVQKHAGRAKEKILQNLGKVDRTADDIFDEHLQNFNRQQNAANKLRKEFSNYIQCVRALQMASKSLMESIGEIYESQWSGHDHLFVQSQSIDMLWQDFNHKLGDQVLIPLNTYQSQFAEMRKKIDKRGRKLVDYDGQRHSFQALQLGMSKKRDDAKLNKGREQLDEAKRTYEILNAELHDELPALYDSRILFLVTSLQSLFSAEQVFHVENSKVFGELEAVVDKLATDSQRGSYSVKKSNGSSLPRAMNNLSVIHNNGTSSPIKNSMNTPEESVAPILNTGLSQNESKQINNHPQDADAMPEINNQTPNKTTALTSEQPSNTAQQLNTSTTITDVCNNPVTKLPESEIATPPLTTPNTDNNTSPIQKNVEELYDIPIGATTDNLPAGVMYKVKSTYKYTREDVDELSFEVDEIIQVIEYEDPEEQEEGWLMGVKKALVKKACFLLILQDHCDERCCHLSQFT